MKFTPHQRRALELGGHRAVTANAGSGKTRVLVERYVQILISGVPVSDVVALTYTEKAASELRKRIAERLAAAISTAPSVDIPRLESIRDTLATAFVGTIHSFCARLLREYPVEADVDAAFTVLERVDAEDMLRACVAEILGEILHAQRSEVSHDRLMDLLRSLGKPRVMDALLHLVGRREVLDRLDGKGGVYDRSDEEILRRWHEHLLGVAERGLVGLRSDLERVMAEASAKARGPATATFEAVYSGDDQRARALAWAELMRLMMTKEGTLRKNFIGSGESVEHLRPEILRINARRKILDPLMEWMASGAGQESHHALLKDSRVLLAIARAVVERYDARKMEEARLDFEDLQLKMRALLRHPPVRGELSRRFRFVMVDEFQDTNTLQMSILLPLLEELLTGNLFIVGDPKQSIYRFRDADVRVFAAAQKAIAASAGENSQVSLGESFRPLRDVAAFVNIVFSRLMDSYEPLIVARENTSPGRVELLLARGGREEVQSQEDLIARRILALLAAKTIVFGQDEAPHPISFRDIALLLRSRRGLEEFEQAFIRNGIPYLVSGGVGYFQSQDIIDVYNYLRFLTNPADDIALAGILRSPFFTVSDAELFQLARSRKDRTLWETLSAPAGPARELLSLSRAANMLRQDLAVAVRLPIAELIARIVAQTYFRAALSGTVRASQAHANLDKLLHMARQFDATGFTSLYDFVGRLRRLIDEEEKEGQAPIESLRDTVQIMTVHAAKGLEFPVVIVPDLQRPIRPDREPFVDDTLGIGLLTSAGAAAIPPLGMYLRENARRLSLEEETRILYVACTRARDMLLLGAGPDVRGGSDCWLSLLAPTLALDEEATTEGRLEYTVTTQRLEADGSVKDEQHHLSVPVLRSLESQPRVVPTREVIPPDRHVSLTPLPAPPKGEIFSASKIRTFAECPAQYFYRYVLGYPLGGSPFAREDEQELADREYPAELRGRLFHAVMEHAPGSAQMDWRLEEELSKAFSREAPFALSTYPSLIADVGSLVKNVLSSQSWREIGSAKDVKTEFSISAALGDDFITGTIDRLYIAHDGHWTVLDYKTDAVSSSEAPARAASYWPQLSFYATMVRRLYDIDVVRTRLLFAACPDVILERVLTTKELTAVEEEIKTSIVRIKSGDFAPRATPCRACPLLPEGCTDALAHP